jgi:hypothetical protein
MCLRLETPKPFRSSGQARRPELQGGTSIGTCSNRKNGSRAPALHNVGAPTAAPTTNQSDRGLLHSTDAYFFFLFALFFSSTTACAAASLEIGTRNGDALT